MALCSIGSKVVAVVDFESVSLPSHCTKLVEWTKLAAIRMVREMAVTQHFELT
jgi:hypothetical protein